jgi:catechol 2,3-dioxygenase-like lactoylglutathione lyase family enzyme
VSRILRGATYLLVADVAATGEYYESVLGFRREYAAGDPPEFAIYSRDGSTIMFHWVEAVDPLYEELQARGATVVYPPTVQPYGMKEFAIRDTTGYVHGFGQEWPPGG